MKHFFLGIGGIGMSGLARLHKAYGHEVSGSDAVKTDLTLALEAEGMPVSYDGGFLPDDAELLIYSEAVPFDHTVRILARDRGLKSMNYFEALGLSVSGKKLLAVAGTHGKTSTSAMLASILLEAGLDPGALVGSLVPQWGNKNALAGKGEYFVVEACEYRRNFMSLKPYLLGITNMEFDHMDFFVDFESYQKAFMDLSAQSEDKISSYAPYDGVLSVPGAHNKMNAGLAAAMARFIGISDEFIASALAKFQGTWRRFEYKGVLNGAKVYDDYAHHPTEIKATLKTLHEIAPDKKIMCVFEPHQYSRTLGLLEDFTKAFELADEVLIPGIYKVRDTEADINAISGETFAKAISVHKANVSSFHSDAEMLEHIKKNLDKNCVLIVMGAGPIDRIFEKLQVC